MVFITTTMPNHTMSCHNRRNISLEGIMMKKGYVYVIKRYIYYFHVSPQGDHGIQAGFH